MPTVLKTIYVTVLCTVTSPCSIPYPVPNPLHSPFRTIESESGDSENDGEDHARAVDNLHEERAHDGLPAMITVKLGYGEGLRLGYGRNVSSKVGAAARIGTLLQD